MGAGHSHGHGKEGVALQSLLASAALTAIRFFVAFATGSIGVLSESVKSLLDLLTALLTWLAVKAAARPPDERHPYGHGKIETLSALIGTALLFAAGGWIASEAVARLRAGGSGHVTVTWWSMALLALGIVVDAERAWALTRVARKTGSQALASDALHFSSDVLSSLAVLIGIGAAWAGWTSADAYAALLVSVFILVVGIQLTWNAVNVLLDAAPKGMAEQVRAAATSVSGVVEVCGVRVRPGGIGVFAEIHVVVDAALRVSEVDGIRAAVAEAVRHACDGVEPTVLAEGRVCAA